ncbi:hypothetical protein DL93DRAFT_2224179 [Clavulina sp. PMI_390]|nr:hypothetical protein DL93DRAFT_2224179 [Clavulina sp. PMI_390]
MARHTELNQGISDAESSRDHDYHRITLDSLPEDLIISILGESLSPWDLVALSQTCRRLHTCASARTAWKLAWSRASNILPPMPLPSLSIPQNNAESLVSTFSPFEPPPTICRSHPGLPVTPRDAYTGGLPDYATSFHQIARVQSQIRKPRLTIRPLISSLYKRSTSTFDNGMNIIGDGSFILFWNAGDVHLFDIHHNMDYTIHMKVSFAAAETFLLEGTEGILLAAVRKSVQHRCIDLFFQPLCHSETPPDGLIAAQRLGMFSYRENASLTLLRFSAHRYLIIVDKQGILENALLQVFDLVRTKTYRLLLDHYVHDAAVYDNTTLVFVTSPRHEAVRPVMTVALADLHEDYEQSCAPKRTFSIYGPTGFYGFSERLSPRAAAPESLPLFWSAGTGATTLAVAPFQLSAENSSFSDPTARCLDWNMLASTSVLPRFLEDESDALNKEQPKEGFRYRLRDAFRKISASSSTRVPPSSASDPPSPRGNPRFLISAMGGRECILSTLNSSRADETGLVVSEYSQSLQSIIHHPVYIENEGDKESNVKVRQTPTDKQMLQNQAKLFRLCRHSDSDDYINYFRWSEVSGKVIMEIVDKKEGVARIELFEFC